VEAKIQSPTSGANVPTVERQRAARSSLHAQGSTSKAPRSTLDHAFSPRLFYALALLAFTLGLMSKPMLVTLPFLLLLLDYWPLRRFQLQARDLNLRTFGPFL